MDTINVLVWGTAKDGACAYFRGHMFDEPLAQMGINLKHITTVNFLQQGDKIALDTSDLEWADVLVYRRYYNTALRCAAEKSCGFLTQDLNAAKAHPHGTLRQDDITRTLWPVIRDAWTGAIIYETDDDHFEIKPWNGYYGDVLNERDLITEMARSADLVTTSTDVLTRRYSRFNPRIRTIRNAIDPDLYVADTQRPDGDDPRLVYYGSTARLRDYAGYPDSHTRKWTGGYARLAVDEIKQKYGLRRVFLGTNEGTERIVGAAFDEQTPYIESIPEFCRALANSHGDIGIAPLLGDDFDQAKSELHWLEYAVTGQAFIGERFSNGGPYQIVRNGVDGLLARGRGEWYETIKKLTLSRDLREQLAGAARERVLAEYDYRVRAQEWADAFRWAAEHAGIGRRNAQYPAAVPG